MFIFLKTGKADGNAKMKALLGGKGANLAEMAQLGIPVPPGFTITTDVCTYYYEHGGEYPVELKGQVEEAMHRLEELMGRKFGDPENPLLVSVRSGAALSMPGMMDTDPESRSQRSDSAGSHQARRGTNGSHMIAIAALSPCMGTWCSV